RLGLVGGGEPAARHLRGHDGAEVELERQRVHDRQARAAAQQRQRAAVAGAVERERLNAGLDRQRRDERVASQPEGPSEAEGAGVDVHLAAARVHEQERCRRADADARRVGCELDPYRVVGDRPDGGVRVVVGEDAAVAEAVQRETLRAPLAHADAVAPARALDQEEAACKRGCRQRAEGGCGGGGDQEGAAAHLRGPKPATADHSSEATSTTSVRGPWTPSTRLSSMSEVAEGPDTSVTGCRCSATMPARTRTASGTSSTTWRSSTTQTCRSGTSVSARRPSCGPPASAIVPVSATATVQPVTTPSRPSSSRAGSPSSSTSFSPRGRHAPGSPGGMPMREAPSLRHTSATASATSPDGTRRTWARYSPARRQNR